VAGASATPRFVFGLLAPQSIADRGKGSAFSLACAFALLVVFGGEMLTPREVTIRVIGFVPVFAAAWVLSRRLTIAVAATAVLLHVLSALVKSANTTSVTLEIITMLVLVTLIRAASQAISRLSLRQPGGTGREELDRSRSPGQQIATHGSTVVPPRMTRRERQVVSLALQGRTNREIGETLFIGERTVETHLSNAYRKLGVESKVELIRRASELDI
jgi:DNA-binding NarL/FixJ family response regulator